MGADDISTSQYHADYSKTAIGVGVSMPLVDVARGISSMTKLASSAGKTNDARMQALAAITLVSKLVDVVNTVTASASPAAMEVVRVSVSLGSSKSESDTRQSSSTVIGSRVSAAGNASIIATGGDTASTLDVIGSSVGAGNNVTLQADGQINLAAAINTSIETSAHSGSGWSVGVAYTFGAAGGATLDFGANKASGTANGIYTRATNTHIKAGNTATLESGGDINMAGAILRANTVNVKSGKNFNLASVQDTSTYASSSNSAGIGVSLCIPPFCIGKSSVGGSLLHDQATSDDASVIEQSGIKAGDGGFKVNVAGNIDLKGAVIASSDKAVSDGTNSLHTGTLTSSDMENHAQTDVKNTGISLSSDMFSSGKYGFTKGVLSNLLDNASESGNSTGQSLSAVSAGLVTITDDKGQQQLTGKTAQATIDNLNRDTADAQTAAQKQDVQGMKQSVDAVQLIKNDATNMFIQFTDEGYRSRFQAEPTLNKLGCAEGANCILDPSKVTSIAATAQDIASNTSKNMVLAVNGILNDKPRAAQLAYQNVENVNKTALNPDGVKPDSIFLMHIAPANNTISELMATAYEKATDSMSYGLANFFGYTNGAETYATLLASRGNAATVSLGHSRGTLVQDSAFTILANRPDANGITYTNPNLTVRGVGGAADMQIYTMAAAKIINDPAKNIKINFIYFSNDPVSTSVFSGGNPGEWKLSDLWQIYKLDNSMHSGYGSGATGSTQVEQPLSNGPQGTPDGNAKLIRYEGGKRVDSAVNTSTQKEILK